MVSSCTCVFLVLTLVWYRSGLVESKIRILVSKLEINGSIELAHVHPESYGAIPSDRHVIPILWSGV